jgi:ParB family chromosome partitioning protein
VTTTEIPVRDDHEADPPAEIVPGQGPVETAVDAEVVWVDPRELIIGDNVRTAVELDRGFVADIKDRGVRQIIPVRRDEAGRLVVQTGQKRVLAAIEVGLDRVRVIVETQALSDERDRMVDRILDQLGENEHRSGISDAEEARATQQLLGLGLTAGQIARRRHIPTKRVKTAAAVAHNEVAMDAVAEGLLDLAQAAVVAEFSDDQTAVLALTTAANKRPEQFDHITQQLRDDREETRLRAELTAELSERGVTVIDRPDTLFSGKIRRLSELRATPDTTPGTELTTEEHAACPGHAAFLENRGSWRPTPERVVIVWVCTDFTGHGHAERYTAPGVTTTGKITGPMTDEQKAARREIVVNNKAWDSATTVRRAWLTTFLARKTAPPEAARWIAQTLAQDGHDVRKAMESDHSVALELLGLPLHRGYASGYRRTQSHAIAAAAAKASPARATTLTVAILVGALEKGTDRHAWRSPTGDQIAYFRQLQHWNYPLSDVEMLVLQPTDTANPNPVEPGPDEEAEPADQEPEAADEEPEAAGEVDDPDIAA